MLSLKRKNDDIQALHGSVAILKDIVKSLPSWEQRWAGNGDRLVEIDVSAGRSVAKGLHKEDAVAVALVEADAGTVYDCHSHVESEIITLVEGMLEIIFQDGEVKTLNPNDTITISPHANHMASFPKWSRAIVTTLPAASNFPGGGRFSGRDKILLG